MKMDGDYGGYGYGPPRPTPLWVRRLNVAISAVAVTASISAVIMSAVRGASEGWNVWYVITIPLFSWNALYYGRRLVRWFRGPRELRGVLR